MRMDDSQKDTDADGVTDDVDTCPTPTGEAVDATGCSDSQKERMELLMILIHALIHQLEKL